MERVKIIASIIAPSVALKYFSLSFSIPADKMILNTKIAELITIEAVNSPLMFATFPAIKNTKAMISIYFS